jgi:hypothetical protein
VVAVSRNPVEGALKRSTAVKDDLEPLRAMQAGHKKSKVSEVVHVAEADRPATTWRVCNAKSGMNLNLLRSSRRRKRAMAFLQKDSGRYAGHGSLSRFTFLDVHNVLGRPQGAGTEKGSLCSQFAGCFRALEKRLPASPYLPLAAKIYLRF